MNLCIEGKEGVQRAKNFVLVLWLQVDSCCMVAIKTNEVRRFQALQCVLVRSGALSANSSR